MKKYNVILAAGNRLFGDTLKAVLAAEPDFYVLSVSGSGIDCIREALRAQPDLLVLAQVLPDITLFQVVKELHRNARGIRFIFILKDVGSDVLRLFNEIECIGAIHENTNIKEFITALRSVARGERYISGEVLQGLRSTPVKEEIGDALVTLTHREREVLYWLAHGRTNKEIAAMMILSDKTVKNHVSHLLKKLGAADRTKAAAIAWNDGLPMIPEDFFLSMG